MRDDAESNVIGALLVVAMAVALAALLYTFVGGSGSSDPPPKAIALARPVSLGSNTVQYELASASEGVFWNGIVLRVENYASAYTITVTGDTWSSAASSSTAWNGASQLGSTYRLMDPGDRVSVQLAGPGSARLTAIDAEANVLLTQVAVLVS